MLLFQNKIHLSNRQSIFAVLKIKYSHTLFQYALALHPAPPITYVLFTCIFKSLIHDCQKEEGRKMAPSFDTSIISSGEMFSFRVEYLLATLLILVRWSGVRRGSCHRGHPFSILISSLKDHILISRMTLYTSHNNTLLIHPHFLCQAHIQSQIVQPNHLNLLISRKISMVTFSSTCFLVYSSLGLAMLRKAVVWAFSHWHCLGQPNRILGTSAISLGKCECRNHTEVHTKTAASRPFQEKKMHQQPFQLYHRRSHQKMNGKHYIFVAAPDQV